MIIDYVGVDWGNLQEYLDSRSRYITQVGHPILHNALCEYCGKILLNPPGFPIKLNQATIAVHENCENAINQINDTKLFKLLEDKL